MLHREALTTTYLRGYKSNNAEGRAKNDTGYDAARKSERAKDQALCSWA